MPDSFSVTVDELAGSPQLSASFANGVSGSRRWKVAWTDAKTLMGELLGGTDESGPEGSVFTPPAPWPDSDFAIVCTQVRIKPLGGDKLPIQTPLDPVTGLPNYTDAEVEAVYDVPPFEPSDVDPTIMREERVEFSGEFMNLSNAEMSWTSDGTSKVQADVTIAKMMGSLELLVFFPWRAVLPVAGIAQAVGSVNPQVITAFGGIVAFAAETLLFLPPSATRTVTAFGQSAWQIQYRLSFKFEGWNRFFNPEGGGDGFGTLWRKVGAGFSAFRPHRLFNYLPLLQGV